MAPPGQETVDCRCEWGAVGYQSLSPADVVIIVDVLSFSTCVDVAVGRGAAILPYAWNDGTATDFATAQHAELAGVRGRARYSLSPASFMHAAPGLRCVLPSPNGAALALHAATTGATVLAGCLRNASAVAQEAARLGATFNVLAAGEHWPDGTLRFAVEDWLGAGAIVRYLPGSRSPEAAAAVATFEAGQDDLTDVLAASTSGRELIARGFSGDVGLAAEFNCSSHVPRLRNGAFIHA
jgi:2-phosphosulfolactate phosphatase